MPADSPPKFATVDAEVVGHNGMVFAKIGEAEKNHNPRKRAAVLIFGGCGSRPKDDG
jgi:hypothetical protein